MILGIAESSDRDGLCPLEWFILLRGLQEFHVAISTGLLRYITSEKMTQEIEKRISSSLSTEKTR